MKSNNIIPHEIQESDKEQSAGHVPIVSVGLAVYNGENYIGQAIESILNQTLPDFELIITDNASTDRTSEICNAYALKDRRISYHRNPTNIGAVKNENLTLSLSQGKYFHWHGHDDYCAPEFFAECVSLLDHDPSVVLCLTTVVQIDGDGKRIGIGPLCDASSHEPHLRFRNVMKMNHNCYEFYAMIRSDVLRKAREQQVYVDSDRTLLAELALYGRYHIIDKELFFRRIHTRKSTVLFPSWRDRMIWYDPAYKTKLSFPIWMQFFDYINRIQRVSLPFTEKARCYGYMIGWLGEGHGRYMIKDVMIVLYKIMQRFFSLLCFWKSDRDHTSRR